MSGAAFHIILLSMLKFERELYKQGSSLIAGIDEVGRGPLAGPVITAAVILPPILRKNKSNEPLLELNDSKKLTPQKRNYLYNIIIEKAIGIGIGIVDEKTIDKINILQATYLAMRKALFDLVPCPDHILVDAVVIPQISIPQTSIIKGDSKSLSIAAASIIAKVTRDNWMDQLHDYYPQYNFNSHKGYGTGEHWEALDKYGPCPIHRLSFAGVKPQSAIQGNLFQNIN